MIGYSDTTGDFLEDSTNSYSTYSGSCSQTSTDPYPYNNFFSLYDYFVHLIRIPELDLNELIHKITLLVFKWLTPWLDFIFEDKQLEWFKMNISLNIP